MREATIGDMFPHITFIHENQKNLTYHKKIHWPSWFTDELPSFIYQVSDMSSTKKPFKCSDTFKLQAGYPHEITQERKGELESKGIKRDFLSEKYKIPIPKLNKEKFIQSCKVQKIFVFTTPVGSHYIRDITLVDSESHPKLCFIYVVNRKAQIITAWCEKKIKGKYKLREPHNIVKNMTYERK
tara:strand:+ start:72 stop:623 length:552 start_codon:yes stop_codon:yes gene_type:complete